jgi:hypothetical protein
MVYRNDCHFTISFQTAAWSVRFYLIRSVQEFGSCPSYNYQEKKLYYVQLGSEKLNTIILQVNLLTITGYVPYKLKN